MKNRATRGGSEGDSDKLPSTSKFHFSKGKYGNVVFAWHGALIQKAEANFADICAQAQARKIFGVADVGIGSDSQRAQNANPEVRTRVGLDSESESEGETKANDGDNEDHGNGNTEDIQNSDVDYHGNLNGTEDNTADYRGNDGSTCNLNADDGNTHNGGQNEAGPSRSELDNSLEYYNRAVDVEKNDGGDLEEIEVDPGPSRLGGRRGRGAKARSRK